MDEREQGKCWPMGQSISGSLSPSPSRQPALVDPRVLSDRPPIRQEMGRQQHHTPQGPHGQHHSPPWPPNWDASQGWNSYHRHTVQDLSNNPQFLGGTGLPNYGATYNIRNAGNMFMGTNYGNVYMESTAPRSAEEFMMNLADRLKVCFRADHMYYASGEGTALRRGQCTPGTRIDIIQGVTSWAVNMSLSSECVYWLSGQAGAGKTTIAYTIAHYFETLVGDGSNKAILGGSFFCSRQFLDTRSASSIVRTIVYQLALRSQHFQAALMEHGRFETVNHGPRSQLMGLLVEPWIQCLPEWRERDEPCYILPIDALDELEGSGGTEFLGALFDVVNQQDLSGLKFFVTSRSEPALVKRIISFPNKQICRLEEVPLEESSADIKLYLDENLVESASIQQIQQLVSDSAGLFIYAATVVEYVKGRDLEEQKSLLNQLLSTSPSPSHRRSRNATTTLDILYLQILETSLVDPRDRGDPDVFEDCLTILHTFLCTIERTSTSVAMHILNASGGDSDTVLDTGIAEGVLHRMHAVLYRRGDQVMSFHKSFSDFLFDKRRSQRFFCNQEQHHRRLANGCFGIMTQQLRFNIADISTSYLMDHANSSLPISVDTNISATLRYACGNWSAHLVVACLDGLESLGEIVNEFLQLRVLFWLEAMSLVGQRGRCQGMIRDAQRWFSKAKDTADLVNALADTAAFAAYHSTSKAALSTPHLYLSSLATFPRHSAIVKTWKRQFGGIPGYTGADGIGGQAQVACITVRNEVTALAVSPNGVAVAVGSRDGFIKILDLSTGGEVGLLMGHTRWVNAVAYSPDGIHIVSGSDDESVRVWNVSTGEEMRVFKGHTSTVRAVAYSPDGNRVVSGSDDESVRVWDVSRGEEVIVLKGHTDTVRAVAYSPHGTHVVSASSNNSIRVWDLSAREEVRILEGRSGPACGFNAVAYSPDGSHVVSGSDDMLVSIWDLSTGEEVRVLKGHGGGVVAVGYSPDGTHIVSGSHDEAVWVWDLSTGEAVRVFRGHTGIVNTVAYSPDGTHIVSGSDDETIRIWELSAWEEMKVRVLASEGHPEQVNAVAYSPTGTHVVSGLKDYSVRLWDLSTREEVRALEGHTDWVNVVAYSPDGTLVVSASSDESVRVWDVSIGEEVKSLEGHTGGVLAVASSPGGTHVVSGSGDNSVRVWDLSTGETVRLLNGHTSWVRGVAYSPDGSRIVSVSDDKSVRVWDLSTGEVERVLEGHTDMVWAVAYSPDGTHVASGGNDQSVRVWDLSTGEEMRVLNGHSGRINAVAYSPDGAHILSGSYDKSIRVWELSTGEAVRVLRGHTKMVTTLAYSPDGTHLASGSLDTSIRVWDVSPQYQPRYIRQQGPDGEYTGWLVAPTDPLVYLMFVQPEALLPDDANVLAIPASAVPHLDFSNTKFGDRWAECYTPRPL